jgi:hypothetical protein
MTLHRFLPPRLAAFLAALALLGACTDAGQIGDEPPEPMGDFLLGHNIVTVNEPAVSPVSRRASDEEWKRVMEKAMDARLGRYDGSSYFHTGISVDGYALAPPGIPLVVAPKSVLIITATVWEDATQTKVAEPKRFTVFEGLSADTVVGSGLTRSKQEQMDTLAANAAKAVHDWMLANSAWFGEAATPAPAPAPAAAPAVERPPAQAPDAVETATLDAPTGAAGTGAPAVN